MSFTDRAGSNHNKRQYLISFSLISIFIFMSGIWLVFLDSAGTAGEIVCVVGANGAGKTTLMRAISGIIPILQGSKFFKNEEVTRHSAAKLTKAGIIQVPEGRLIIKELSVVDNLR